MARRGEIGVSSSATIDARTECFVRQGRELSLHPDIDHHDAECCRRNSGEMKQARECFVPSGFGKQLIALSFPPPGLTSCLEQWRR